MSQMVNKCTHCDKRAVSKDGLCYTHHKEAKEAEWLDNTDINNLGIVKWCHEMLPEYAFNTTPQFHKELFMDLLSLYNPNYRNKYERLYELISFRESAKSTAANTLFISYIIAHNGQDFKFKVDGEIRNFTIKESTIVIISETAGSAEDFTVRIRDTFQTSERLRYYYKLAIEDAIDSITGQWTRSAYKINGTFVQGIGTGQQIRGKVKGVSRPSLVIADDIYSENNTVSDERRLKIKKWWNNSVMNSVDNLTGKVVVLGTILHDDTIIVELENNPRWKHKKIPVMPIDKFHEFTEKHTKVDWDTSTCWIPHSDVKDKDERNRLQRNYFDKVQASKDWGLSWPERIDLYLLAIKWQEAVFNRSTSGLYQEYFHITTSPLDKRFRPEYFQTLQPYDLKYENGYNWIRLNGEESWRNINIEFGVDLAGEGADDAVISVVGILPDMRLLVLHQAIGKWGIRDDVAGDTGQDIRINRVIIERSALRRIGVVDEAFRLALRYHPSKIKVGVAGEEPLIVTEMRRVFQENKDYRTHIEARPQKSQEGKKEARIFRTLIPYYETRMVYHAPGLSKLEYQLEYLGKSTHDDCADALEVAVWMIECPYTVDPSLFGMGKEEESDAGNRPLPFPFNQKKPTNFWQENWRWYGS